ncbi:MAG: hypothetical protein QNJ46_00290 [Leptolyngbyaceae cyanobacterium MO_188.B28]|nr:hypothetical protein [Leptolyngbyaceae cyanobacterium MO_188.B28]
MENLVVTPTSFNQAMLFALVFGFAIGVLLSVTEIGKAFVKKRLHIKEGEVLKDFVILASIGALLILCTIVLNPLVPEYGERKAIVDRNVEMLGFGLNCALMTIGGIIVHAPGRFIAIRIAKAMRKK